MPSLPIPGASKNAWGKQINEFLRVAHNDDGSLDADVLEDVIVNGLGMPTAEEAAAVFTGFADQRQLAPDGTSLGWFQGPVLMANWAPYKAENDGMTPVATKIQSFLSALASSRIPGVLLPGSYQMDAIVDVGSDTTLHMHGANLLTYATGTGSGGYDNTVPVLRLRNVDNVTIEGGTINGRKTTGGFGSSEHKHGVTIEGGSHITLRDLLITDCKGDGVYVEPESGVATRGLVMERVTCDGNHRQGLSILALDSGRFSDCDFINTDGVNPQSGVDIEPESIASVVRDLVFTNCHFDGNTGSGFVLSAYAASTVQRGVTVVDSSVRGNDQWGVWLTNAHDVTIRNAKIEDNGTHGVWMLGGDNSFLTIRESWIRNNGQHGIHISGLSGAMSLSSARIVDNYIYHNSASTTNSFNGIRLGGDTHMLTADDIIIAGNTIGRSGGTTHNIGIAYRTNLTITNSQTHRNNLTQGNTSKQYNSVTSTTTPPAGVTSTDNL